MISFIALKILMIRKEERKYLMMMKMLVLKVKETNFQK